MVAVVLQKVVLSTDEFFRKLMDYLSKLGISDLSLAQLDPFFERVLSSLWINYYNARLSRVFVDNTEAELHIAWKLSCEKGT